MKILMEKFDEDREISSYDEVHIVLSRLEAVRIANDMGDLDPARIEDETHMFHLALKKIVQPPDFKESGVAEK